MSGKKKIIYFLLIPVFVFGIAGAIKVYSIKKSLYPYNVAVDYNYNFKDGINLQLVNNRIVLPDTIHANYTAFVRVYIKSSFLGFWVQPMVEINSDQNNCVQHFKHGARGYQYLNISSLVSAGAKEIELVAHHLSIDDQTVELTVFENLDVSKSKILIIAPHPDDAEIAAFGLYSKNPNSFILTITAGESGEYNYPELFTDTAQHYLKKGEIRTWNSITIPLLNGISPENTLNLGFFDGTLKRMHDTNPSDVASVYVKTNDINIFRKQNISSLKDSITGTSNWSSLVENIKIIITEFNPDFIITPYPTLDQHEDHLYSSIALFQALKELNRKDGHLLFYINHYVLSIYYPYGYTGGVVSLPPNFNNDIYFHSFQSYPLNPNDQVNKLLALEAMNDLRPNTDWRYWDKSVVNTLKTMKNAMLGNKLDFFRKAVRSNELFFELPIREIYDDTIFQKITKGNNQSFGHQTHSLINYTHNK